MSEEVGRFLDLCPTEHSPHLSQFAIGLLPEMQRRHGSVGLFRPMVATSSDQMLSALLRHVDHDPQVQDWGVTADDVVHSPSTAQAVPRSAGALAIGSVLQGLNKPVNDLSRGGQCLCGWETLCARQVRSGYDVDGGFAEYVLANAASAARLPDDLDYPRAAPLVCGGTVVLDGVPPGDFALTLYDIGMRAVWMRGSIAGTRADLARPLELAAQNRIRSVENLARLSDVNEVLDKMQKWPTSGRTLLELEHPT